MLRICISTLLLLSAYCPAQAQPQRPAVASAVASIEITVSDVDRAVEFYSKVLSFEKISENEASGAEAEHLEGIFGLHTRSIRMRLGNEFLELTEYLTPKGLPMPLDTRANDRWFQHIAIITSNMDEAYRRLREFKVQHASTAPQRLPDWNPNAGGIRAFYFRDPDGHFLEVLQFPEGKGRPEWHRSEPLFLGIDHTAIVVANTDASLRFYRDLLGMKVVGESENYGTEQEHLNNVFGARLRITSLRAESGPGVEFLEYLAPQGGRAYPADEKPNDLMHWQTRIVSKAIHEAALRQARANFISSAVVKQSVVVRDPDGHAVQLIEENKP